jgi:uncharacterized protein YjbI with pentapeptide repeats
MSPEEEKSPPLVGWGLKALWAILALLGVGILIWIGYQLAWTGFSGRTLWEWLVAILIPATIPVVVALAAYLLNKAQRERELQAQKAQRESEQKIEQDRQEEATLQAYFHSMNDLLLARGLKESQPGSTERTFARSYTVWVLRALESSAAKNQIIQFLREHDLVHHGHNQRMQFVSKADRAIVNLAGAKLQKIDLRGVDLSYLDLSGADLREANLSSACLAHACLNDAELQEADLTRANLTCAWLRTAFLHKANLAGAIVDYTDWENALYNNATTPPPGGFPASAINVDEQH